MPVQSSCVRLFLGLLESPRPVSLNGERLDPAAVLAVARHGAKAGLSTDPAIRERIRICHERVIKDVRDGVPVYGCNTGYGQRADRQTLDGTVEAREWAAREISNAISLVDVSVGPPFEQDITRAAVLIRANMLMRGVSGIKAEDLELLCALLNQEITPIVSQYGGLGASGDLAHNARVVSALRHHPEAQVWDASGRRRSAGEALAEAGIGPLELDPKAGLALCNGDNFSTALATLLFADTLEAVTCSLVLGAMAVEALQGTDRCFHPLLDAVRPHPGQREAAAIYRFLLKGSRLARQELQGHRSREDGVSVQDGYSLRALSQYHSVHLEQLSAIHDALATNMNSASDNPLWAPPELAAEGETPWQWVSGANFLAAHMAEALDAIRRILSRIVKLCDRHLARLVSPHMSNGLPSNLSGPAALSQGVFKGVQIQAGMFDVYSMLLSIPVGTFFGVHEEGNQDVTTHALTSGILGLELLRVTRYALAQNLLALAQAVDLRGGPGLLSPRTRPLYEAARVHVEHVVTERPLHGQIESLYSVICSGEVASVLRDQVFLDYEG